MGKEAKPRAKVAMVTLRNVSAAQTATTVETAVTAARLKDYRAGFGIAAVSAFAVDGTDEQYDLIFEGRQEGSGASYTELGRITLGAAALGIVAPFITAGVFSVSLPNLKGDMRLNTVHIGSSTSINHNYVGIVVTDLMYGLDKDTTIAP